jgi:NAD(P)-dependent dehydrogenase (short-subunit alcohol dehydrogenase family)
MESRNKTVFVTGGASGLGEATVRWFVEKGNRAVVFDLSEDAGKALESELGTDKALFVRGDVTDEADMQAAVDAAVEKFGGIDVLVCCAGIGSGVKIISKKGVHPLDSFNKVIQIDLVGTFNAIRLCADKMQHNEPNEDGERGVIVCTSSIAAWEGQIGQVAYSAAKGGVNGIILTAAREFTSIGLRINGIAPGIMGTPQLLALPPEVLEGLAKSIPFPSRLGHPEEFAHTVNFLVENAVMNGTTIRLDGALRMRER